MRVRECHANEARIIVAEVDQEFAAVGDLLIQLGSYLNLETTDEEYVGSLTIDHDTNFTCVTATLIS